jgi:sugar (pentulose or hexulose) kinase
MDKLQELGVHAEEIRAIGGGAKSPRWLQMRADVLGKLVAVPEI